MQKAARSPVAAWVAPFVLFMGGLALVSAAKAAGGEAGPFFLKHPEYWVYPLQTVVCAAALIFFWRRYDFSGRPLAWIWAVIAGVVALGVWLSPQLVFGASPRRVGFDPTVFENDPALYWLTVIGRFARLVIVVPLVEEIFWRGFLMRYLIRDDFEKVPPGTYSPVSFFAVAGLFMLVHSTADWPAALATGLLYNGLMVFTKSLPACIAAHAITNLGLGVYIMSTRQWGFW